MSNCLFDRQYTFAGRVWPVGGTVWQAARMTHVYWDVIRLSGTRLPPAVTFDLPSHTSVQLLYNRQISVEENFTNFAIFKDFNGLTDGYFLNR